LWCDLRGDLIQGWRLTGVELNSVTGECSDAAGYFCE
jgi:hypothetical protein